MTTSPALKFIHIPTAISFEIGNHEKGAGFRLSRTQSGVTTLRMYNDDGRVAHREEFGPEHGHRISDLLDYSQSTARAIDADRERGVTRANFVVDRLWLDELRLSVQFDLACPSSNDEVEITMFRWTDDFEDSVAYTTVTVTLDELLSSVAHIPYC